MTAVTRDHNLAIRRDAITENLYPVSAVRPFTISLMLCGSGQTRLIVVRGNSGSGKSSVAKAIRSAYGDGIA
jgi:ABC-type glutathione transport system ATPase component